MQLDLRYLAFAAAATGDSDDEDDHYKDDGRGQGQGQGGRGGRTLQRGFCIAAPRMTQPPPPQPPLPPLARQLWMDAVWCHWTSSSWTIGRLLAASSPAIPTPRVQPRACPLALLLLVSLRVDSAEPRQIALILA